MITNYGCSTKRPLNEKQQAIADLLGHEHEQITSRRYGSVTDVSRLKQAVELLRLPI